DEIDRIVLAPFAPAPLDHLARFEIERNAKAERRLAVRVVGRGHAEVHDAVALRAAELLLSPDMREETLDAPVVQALGEAFAARFPACVVRAGLALRQAVLRELVQCIRPVGP